MTDVSIVASVVGLLGSGAFVALAYWLGRRHQKAEAEASALKANAKVSKKSKVDKDEIVKLPKAALRKRGAKWVRPND
jgi:hypothetical protein